MAACMAVALLASVSSVVEELAPELSTVGRSIISGGQVEVSASFEIAEGQVTGASHAAPPAAATATASAGLSTVARSSEGQVEVSASFEIAEGQVTGASHAAPPAAATATASAGLFDADSGVLVHQLFSGRHVPPGRHSLSVNLSAADVPPGRQLELRVVSVPATSPPQKRYVWEGVVGNTGPVVGPGALKSLNPARTIQVAGDQVVWCVGYNERQPGCFVFNTTNPQSSTPVSPANFERVFGHVAFDGRVAYLANCGNTPESSNYYHLPEVFVVGFDLTKTAAEYSPAPNNRTHQFCMHNFTAPGAQKQVCSTGTGRPTPPWTCKTDGCVSTSNPETWLALDFTHHNTTVPADCNSNDTWSGRCHYSDQPTGIAVQRKGDLLLVSHAYAANPGIKVFDKRTGADRGTIHTGSGPSLLSLAADEQSVWTMLHSTTEANGDIVRFDVPGATAPSAADRPLATVTGVDTACDLAVHPSTDELWVVERKTQAILRFPSSGGSVNDGKEWGQSLNLSFPYIAGSPNGAGFGMDDMICASLAFSDNGDEVWITDPGSRRIIRVNTKTEEIQDVIMFLTVQYTAAVDWNDPKRVFSNFLEFEIDYDAPLTPTSGWKLKRNWGTALPAKYHAQIGLTHWSFAGFQAVVTTSDGHTLGKTSISPNDLDPDPANDEVGEASLFVELMQDGTLRPLATFPHGVGNVNLHPDASLRSIIFDRNSNYTWIGIAPWNGTAMNWSFPFRTIANVSESKPQRSPHFSGGQGQTAPVMDVDDPHEPGAKLLMILEGGNSPTYDRNHLGAVRWNGTAHQEGAESSSAWIWTASPGGNWSDPNGAHKQPCNVSMNNNGTHSQTFLDTCIVEPDGSLDRCGGHFPCAANVALTTGQNVIYGFNGEGWNGGQANQWLHFDALSGLFIGQFGTVNGIHDPRYKDAGWAAPGCAGNSFAATLVTTKSGVFLYHNDESVHGGVHRWRINLENIQRKRYPVVYSGS